MGSLLIDNFSGGLNLRDSPNQLSTSETAFAFNFGVDQRGALKRRKGCADLVALPGTSGTDADIHYSETLNLWLCARQSSGAYKLFSRPGDLSGSWTDRGTIASATSARARFADWPGSTAYCVIATDTADATNGGVYTLDSTPTLTKRHSSPKSAVAVWQNKVWVTPGPADVAAGYGTRLVFSAAGDPTTYSSFIDIRDKDGAGLTALGVVGGALVAFKKRSTYRVTDSSTGAYTTIDVAAGCVNPRAVAALRGRLYVWAPDGIYESDGIGALRNVGDKLRPLYLSSGTDTSTVCAGTYEDRVVFSGLLGTPFSDEAVIEYSPQVGTLVCFLLPGNNNQIRSFAAKDGVLHAAIADGNDLTRMFTETPGEDSAVGVTAQWDTPWLLPNSGMLSRIHRARFQGLVDDSDVTLDALVYRDWDPNAVANYSIGTPLFSTTLDQAATDVQSLGHGSAFKIRLVTGTALGNVAIRALQLIDQSLAHDRPGYPAAQRRGNSNANDNGGPPYLPPPAP